MRQKGKNRGFTMIELMIVIAIIAAISIPGLLSSQRSTNERATFGSLKTFVTAEADFRANDRDSNRVQDYWTADVCGLYSLSSTIAPNDPIKLIDINLGAADISGGPAIDPASRVVAGGNATTAAMSTFTRIAPKAKAPSK